jgi:hypothetical protein
MSARQAREEQVEGLTSMRQVRCPHCHRLAAEASPGARLRVKCNRCKAMFVWPKSDGALPG